jgi:hypothetical protein
LHCYQIAESKKVKIRMSKTKETKHSKSKAQHSCKADSDFPIYKAKQARSTKAETEQRTIAARDSLGHCENITSKPSLRQ